VAQPFKQGVDALAELMQDFAARKA